MSTVSILGFPVSGRGVAADVDAAFQRLSGTDGAEPFVVACANPHSLVVAGGEPRFASALKSADLLLPDGIGIVLAARLLGSPVPGRVAGMDFFLGLSARVQARGGGRYYFLGSSEAVLARIAARLARDYPDIVVCGTYAPPYADTFSAADSAAMVAAVKAARPDVLWVGMTAPKQELWIAAHSQALAVPVIAAVGAVFDFYAGTKKRAPEWLCRLGLEWLPRLLREPGRLWRRNFISTPVFLVQVMQQRLGPRSKRRSA